PSLSQLTAFYNLLTDVCDGPVVTLTIRDSGMVYSPAYPVINKIESECILIIQPDHIAFWDSIKLWFHDIDVKKTDHCEDEYVKVQDHVTNAQGSTSMPGEDIFCGTLSNVQWVSRVRGAKVKIILKTDGSYDGRGYSAEYSLIKMPLEPDRWETGGWSHCSRSCGGGIKLRSVTCYNSKWQVKRGTEPCHAAGYKPTDTTNCNTSPCSDEAQCGLILESKSRVIRSPGYPLDYPKNQHCEIEIVNKYGGCIMINFKDFALEPSQDCNSDKVKIQTTNSTPVIYCGTANPPRWVSDSPKAKVIFISDGERRARGFSAIYDFIDECNIWHAGQWSECTVTCGSGMRFRSVICRNRANNVALPDSNCPLPVPLREEICQVLTNCVRETEITEDQEKTPWYTKYYKISRDYRLYRDFENNYYRDHGFGRVKSENPPDWKGFLTFSSAPDLSDLRDVIKLSAKEMSVYGHQAEDFIIQCSFDEKKCTHRDFHTFQHDTYGNCFTFNHGYNRTIIRDSKRPGPKQGLKITLYVEQNEYIILYGQEAGVRVLVHPPHITPFPEDDGITVKPGVKTSIAIRQVTIERKGPPYGNCSHVEDFNTIYGDHYNYSSLACQKTCLHDFIDRECECVDTLLVNKTRCKLLDREQDMCKQLMAYFYQSGVLPCECSVPCSEKTYESTISQSLWPSNKYVVS
ncbi:uncharacterized protein LOC144345072, partial [Saccoglossus kowalevskii]